ncbi:MAG: DUF1573 domain-containing protein [Anaerolineales bacterium]|nr:DUF1573 domain-containing protein [Anaerolineales bacterium]
MMRKSYLGIFLLISLLLVACTSDQPSISFESKQFDLGDVVNGEIVSRDVILHNDGDSPLVVETVSTSCGCTQASLDPMTISPGEVGVLHIDFDSGAHGLNLTGKVTRQIFINSNDPQQPEALVEFTANILTRE